EQDGDYTDVHHDLSTVHELDSRSIDSEQTMHTTTVPLKKKIITPSNGVIRIYRNENSYNHQSNNAIRHQRYFDDYTNNDEVINDMDDDINYDDQSINEFDITDESLNCEPYSRSQVSITLGKDNQITDISNRRSSKSHTSLNTANWKVLKPNKSKEYTLAVSPRPPLPKNLQTYGRGNSMNKRDHSHLNGFNNHVNGNYSGVAGGGGGHNGPFDYWTLPRNSQPHYKLRSAENKEFYMPGNLFLNEKSLPRTRRKGHRNVRERSETLLGGSVHSGKHSHNRRISSKHTDKVESSNNNNLTHYENDSSNATDAEKRRSELKVYFRFSRGTLSDPFTFDYFKNKELLIQLQARCRGWIARSKSSNQRTEENAVKCIQKNASIMLNPWFRLMLALKPLIRTHRSEEELLFLRSELERYKALVRMLRFENAEYQARVANLLQLLEQMSTNVSNTSTVQGLVQQISEALSKNQEFWQTLAADNKALHALAPQKSANMHDTEQVPLNHGTSPMTKLKHDAEFYRDQVELLREEADEQQLRSAEHYRNQVRVLSERVEQLQHVLALESSKVERLSSELEEKQSIEAEGKAYVRNLELMVNQLSKQLEQRSKLLTTGVGNDDSEENQNDDKDVKTQELITELQNELATHRDLVVKLKEYLSSHSEMSSQLDSNTQSALDLLNSPILLNKTNLNQQHAQHFFGPSRTQSREEVNDLTPRSNTSHQLAEMKRQLVFMQKQLIESEDTVKQEAENREELEAENYNLYDKISILDRQLRHIQDEYDELVKKEMINQRTLKDVQELLDDESRKCTKLEQQNKELEQQLAELREYNEPEDDLVTKEWESMKSKLRADAMFYKRSLDQLREEYEQYRIDNDSVAMQRQLTEKEEKVNILEKEKQQWRMELDIQNVKLQNATSLLEDTELRLKMLNRERTAQMHRMSQLETERDELIRQAASITGRAAADREMAAAKLREMDELRSERDMLRKELTEVKQALAGSTAENAAERRQLQARLRETEVHNEARISDIKAELERVREELEQLQVELQTTQASEMELRSVNQHQKWKINELEDQVIHYTSRISGLERRSIDLDAELVRAKADLSASRESASLRRATKTRMADEWLNILNITSETEDYDDDNGEYHKEIVLLKRRSRQNVNDTSDELLRQRLRIGQSENDLLKNDPNSYTSSSPILKDSRYRSESVLPTIGRIYRKYQPTHSDSINKLNSKSKRSSTNLKLNGMNSSNNTLQGELKVHHQQQQQHEFDSSDEHKEDEA
ncbi:nonmuscle myosin II heavy chain, partial [Schistosoma japonicum]